MAIKLLYTDVVMLQVLLNAGATRGTRYKTSLRALTSMSVRLDWHHVTASARTRLDRLSARARKLVSSSTPTDRRVMTSMSATTTRLTTAVTSA